MGQGSLPPATAEGTLETSPLAQVMAHALDRRMSGTLELEAKGGAAATVVLHEGWPYKARTSEQHYLGMVLHTLGIIDDTKLNASLARLAKERRPHGHILMEMGSIDQDGLLRGLRTQLTEKLEPLFGLPPDTMFRFYESVDALPDWGGPEVAAIDPLPLLWSGLLRSPPWPQVEGVIRRIAPDAAMRFNARLELSRFRFSKAAAELVELMRSTPLTLEGIFATTLVEERHARLLLYLMLLTKQVVFTATEARRPTPPPMPPIPPPTVQVSQPPSRATPASVFPAAAMPRGPTIPPKIGSAPPPARGSAVPPRPSAPPPGVALTPELAAFRQRIIDRVATINDEDYFEVLGIPHGSPAGAVQAAFQVLAKTWHPDRLAPQLFDVKDLSVKVFSRMNDARATLTSSDLRDPYITSLLRGVRPDRHAVEETNAQLEFQKAEFFLKKKDYLQAEKHCRKAREAEPANADYLALLTWIEVEKEGPASERIGEHIEQFTVALKLSETCERAYYYRGLLYKRINRMEKAYLDFKAAVGINPNNIDAARETHLYKKRAT